MSDPERLMRAFKRLGLSGVGDGIERDGDGNVTIAVPVAEATAAVIINPSYSDALGPVCTRCKAPWSNTGVVVAFPPPLEDADPIRICEDCIKSFWVREQPFRLDWQ